MVDARLLVDLVRAAVAGDGTLVRATSRRVVRTVRLGDVVLDERVRRPAVDGEVAVSIRPVVGIVVDRP